MTRVIRFLEKKLELGFELESLIGVGATDEDLERGFWKAFDSTLDRFPLRLGPSSKRGLQFIRDYLGDPEEPTQKELGERHGLGRGTAYEAMQRILSQMCLSPNYLKQVIDRDMREAKLGFSASGGVRPRNYGELERSAERFGIFKNTFYNEALSAYLKRVESE